MGTNNKLTETYLPDKAARKEKIVVGLSGGIDSLVTAYLLKIQRYELIGVTIAPSHEELGDELFSCSVNDKKIESIQAFCHQLGIPHFVVKIPREFKEKVVEKWMSRKALGELPDQCWDCHALRMQFLHEKMKELGAKTFATGHYGKINRQDADSVTFIQSSNDESFDQSGLLSRLPQEILHDLMLPLSDLQKKEVLKLAENFGVQDFSRTVKMFHCLPETEATTNFLNTKLPARFKKDGGIFGEEDERLADHEGVFRFRRGALVISQERQELYFAKFVSGEKKILLHQRPWFERKNILLRNCEIPPETSWTIPFRGVLLKEGVSHDGWFYPKSLNSCAVELDHPAAFVEGEILPVLKKKGKNARILLTGTVNFIEEENSEGDANVIKVNHSYDF